MFQSRLKWSGDRLNWTATHAANIHSLFTHAVVTTVLTIRAEQHGVFLRQLDNQH